MVSRGAFAGAPLRNVKSGARILTDPRPTTARAPGDTVTARDALTTLRTQLSDALLGEDASAGRELLNQALDDWQARVSVEEELADHELPGVEVTASALPHVPLPPWYERDPTLPRDTAARCPT